MGVLGDRAIGMVLVAMSTVYFAVVIVGVLFLVARRYGVAPLRLARDSALSVLFNLLAFAVLYRSFGIGLEHCIGPAESDPTASLYFSMVTFSTLGYGDFRPCEVTRVWAASQAILGNLHLAIIVASAFLVVEIGGPNKDERDELRGWFSPDQPPPPVIEGKTPPPSKERASAAPSGESGQKNEERAADADNGREQHE